MTADPWIVAYEAARRAWPAFEVSCADFGTHCQKVLGEPLDLDLAPDLYLACACLRGDAAAAKVLESELQGSPRAAIARVCPEPAFIEEVMQELLAKLLVGPRPRLERFAGRSPLSLWLRAVATRLAIDMARAEARWRPSDEGLEHALASFDFGPEVGRLRERYGDSLQAALSATMRSLSAHDRQVLRMHLVDGLSIDQIARPYQVHRATAARWLATIRSHIFTAVRDRLLAAHPQLKSEDFESVVRAVRSQLHLSVSRVFPSATRPPP